MSKSPSLLVLVKHYPLLKGSSIMNTRTLLEQYKDNGCTTGEALKSIKVYVCSNRIDTADRDEQLLEFAAWYWEHLHGNDTPLPPISEEIAQEYNVAPEPITLPETVPCPPPRTRTLTPYQLHLVLRAHTLAIKTACEAAPELYNATGLTLGTHLRAVLTQLKQDGLIASHCTIDELCEMAVSILDSESVNTLA